VVVVESIFAQRLEEFGERIAIIASDGAHWTYVSLAQAADAAGRALAGAPVPVIVEAANTVECIVAYLACLRARFPVLLAEPGSTARDPRIADTFHAAYIFRAATHGEWRFEPYAAGRADVHPDLCLLLSTSGSTGSPKLVRLSHTNIESNAQAIAAYLGIGPDDRALTSLPAFYSYGMSVINSHLAVGACLLLTEDSVAQEAFWQRCEKEGATSFAGVPFTFEILERVGFRSRRYPYLRYLTQAGGRLSAEMVQLYAEWADSQDKQFFVMYGQTEAAPRMAYVPPAQLRGNAECIGVPIPGGSFELRLEDGTLETRPDRPAELVYRGPNVMMGYAERAADLALGQVVDALRTGDLACRKANGNYYLAGRMSRFVKIVGKRISLDEIEHWLEQQGVVVAVAGSDEVIAVAVARNGEPAALKVRLLQRFSLPAVAVEVARLDLLPTLASGKIDHRSVLRLVREACRREEGHATLAKGFADILGIASVLPTDSFLDLGGDSVSFVEVTLLLEETLGRGRTTGKR
jgi:acyl-CoA synthetase (AMP-forming)/AMP-acid ligase II